MIHVIGSWYMAKNGGFKPCPKAFIKFLKEHNLNPKKVFFLGDRLVDMTVADRISREMNFKAIKCLILRGKNHSLGEARADYIVKSLDKALSLIKRLKPNLLLTDFDNTLVRSFWDKWSDDVEHVEFWEKHSCNILVRLIYGLVSQLDYLFFNRKPFSDTKKFLESVNIPVIIHSLSPESVIKKTLKEMKIEKHISNYY